MKNGLSLIILIAPALIVILVLFAGGLALGLSQSLGYMPIIGAYGFSLNAYLELLRSPGFLPSLLLTIFVSVTATGIAVSLAVITALTLRKHFVGKKLVSFLYQFPLTIPHLVVAVGMMMLVSQSGLLARAAYRVGVISDSSQFPILVFDDLGIAIILVYIWKEIPFIGLIALAVLQSVGNDYEEQARTLGANTWQTFRHVLLPLIIPGILPGSIIIFAYTFSSFEVPFLLGKSYPAMLSVLSYRMYIDVDLDARPQAMAMSILIALFVLILVVLYRRVFRTPGAEIRVIGDRRRLKGCPTCTRVVHLMVIGAIVGGVLLPMIPLLAWSVSHSWFFPAILPAELSGRAWAYIGSPLSKVLGALTNSILIAGLVTLAAVALGIPAGRALGLRRFQGKALFEFLILAPIIVPGLAVIMGIHVLFIKLRLVDTLFGVALVHLLPSLPYMIMVMSGVFANYNVEFEQQAYSLGAGRIRTFIHVTVPAILPGIVTGSLFVFLISWSQYILTVLIGGGRVITLPVLLFAFAAAGDNAVTAALCIVFLVPAVLILVFTSRYLSGESGAMGGFSKL